MEKKFELTKNIKTHSGRTLYQIRALVDFGDVKAGDLGGWLENENSLAHDGAARFAAARLNAARLNAARFAAAWL